MKIEQMTMPKEVILEHVACPMGCSSQDKPILTGHDRLHGLPGDFDIVACQHCGLMRTNPRPSAETIGFYYPDDYGPYQGTQISSADNDVAPSVWKRLAKFFIRFNTDCVPEIAPGRMLEIGCASGGFLDKMTKLDWQVEGIEFSDSAASAARKQGYSVQTGSLESIGDYAEPFDLVTGWMVVEHLHQPVEALEKLARWTNPDGWLAISVPNAGAVEFNIFKDKWHALHLPNHLTHFTPETLEKMLDRAGWRVERVFHQRVISSQLDSLGYVILERFPKSRVGHFFAKFSERGLIWNIALYPLAWLLSHIGQTGRMTVWAQKK